jgi:hypothetical protein
VIGVPGYPDWHLSDAALNLQIDHGEFVVGGNYMNEHWPTGRIRIIIEGDATRVEPYARAIRELLVSEKDFRGGTAGPGS